MSFMTHWKLSSRIYKQTFLFNFYHLLGCPMQVLSANGWKLVLHRRPTLRTPTGRWEAVRSGGPVVEGCCLRWNFGYLHEYQRISMARKCMISLQKSVIKPLCKLPWDILVRLCIYWHLKKLNCWKRELQKKLDKGFFWNTPWHTQICKQTGFFTKSSECIIIIILYQYRLTIQVNQFILPSISRHVNSYDTNSKRW